MAAESRSAPSVALNPRISADQLSSGHDYYLRASAVEHGRFGFTRDMPYAFQLYLTAAESYSHAKSRYNVACFLMFGADGIDQNELAAKEIFETFVEEDNPHQEEVTNSMINLGFLLLHSDVVTKDPMRAKQLFERARSLGDTGASLSLGALMERGAQGIRKDAAAAKELYEEAAKAGNLQALVALGMLLLLGADGVDPDLVAAKESFEHAAQQGHVGAMNCLGQMFMNGMGVQKDPVAARDYFQSAIAAQQDHIPALYSLGCLLKNGDNGVEVDSAAAEKLFERGAELGHLGCANNLVSLLMDRENRADADLARATALLAEAFMRNSDNMCSNNIRTTRGYRCSSGEPLVGDFSLVEQTPGGMDAETLFIIGQMNRTMNPPMAKLLFEQAAEKGHVASMVNLGNMLLYDNDNGVDKNPSKAKRLFEQAVSGNSPKAMFNLANLLLRGDIGVRRDITRGLELLERSVKLEGHPLSKTMLAQILLSEESDTRDPVRAARLLESAVQETSFSLALHELAVLYERGDRGVPCNPHRSATLFVKAAQEGKSAGSTLSQSIQHLLAAGEDYVTEIEDYMQYSICKPRTCLLLTVGGSGCGKTCTIRSLRGMPFLAEHVPTQTAAMSKCVIEPGRRALQEDMVSEFDFNENSFVANASRTGFIPSEIRSAVATIAPRFAPRSPPQRDRKRLLQRRMKTQHGDVIERVRRAVTQNEFPQGIQRSVLRCWDMAGQSEYEMVNSLFITRADILLFVVNLQNVRSTDNEMRNREIAILCYWMQLAHAVVPEPSRGRAVIVGTHKGNCGDEVLNTLHDLLQEQLGAAVYNSWIWATEAENGNKSHPYCNLVAIENSSVETDPDQSGISQLERIVDKAADAIISRRGEVPLRWLALADKLERNDRIYLSRKSLEELCAFFPGFHWDASKRNKEVLEAARCLASMGRVILFELSGSEYYVFTDADAIVRLAGKVVAPDLVLRNRMSHADITLLRREGRISRSCLFNLWDECRDEEKDVILKLLCEYDVLMLLQSDEESKKSGTCIIGVPALLPSGWEDFRWSRSVEERDLAVSTCFRDLVPHGFIGTVIAHLHRNIDFIDVGSGWLDRLVTHFRRVMESVSTEPIVTPLVKIKANAVLLTVSDGSRIFVGFKAAERRLYWKFRGRQPMELAWACIRQVERLLQTRMNFVRKHIIVSDCTSGTGTNSCGMRDGLEVKIPQGWLFGSCYTPLPMQTVACHQCRCLHSSDNIIHSHLQVTSTSTPSLYPQPVTPPLTYKVFLSHAGPDKLTLARPIFEALERHGIPTFLDCECLLVVSSTAPEVMHRAMREADIGIFILSPEFAARRWTLKELRHFIHRSRISTREKQPVILPVFYRLGVYECYNVYQEDGVHAHVLREEGFFESRRQSECSTVQAAEAMRAVATFSGVEGVRKGGGAPLSSAEIVSLTVGRVLRSLNTGNPGRAV